jgi:hypothetical protein
MDFRPGGKAQHNTRSALVYDEWPLDKRGGAFNTVMGQGKP